MQMLANAEVESSSARAGDVVVAQGAIEAVDNQDTNLFEADFEIHADRGSNCVDWD